MKSLLWQPGGSEALQSASVTHEFLAHFSINRIKHLPCFSLTGTSQGYQTIGVRKYFLEKFQLIDADGMIEYHNLAAPTEIIYVSIRFRPGFPSLGTIHILGWIMVCCGRLSSTL